jgi:hypothetical protein
MYIERLFAVPFAVAVKLCAHRSGDALKSWVVKMVLTPMLVAPPAAGGVENETADPELVPSELLAIAHTK